MVDPSWVLALMLKAEPTADASPWRPTYESTAEAIARAATANPLPLGIDREAKTAALLVSVAWFESHFQPNAEGDHVKLGGGRKGRAQSFCAMQVHASNFATLHVTRAELEDVGTCIATGLRLLHISFGVCRNQPLEHRLAHYAVGGNACTLPTRGEDVHRMKKALWLFAHMPPPRAAT